MHFLIRLMFCLSLFFSSIYCSETSTKDTSNLKENKKSKKNNDDGSEKYKKSVYIAPGIAFVAGGLCVYLYNKFFQKIPVHYLSHITSSSNITKIFTIQNPFQKLIINITDSKDININFPKGFSIYSIKLNTTNTHGISINQDAI